MKEQNITLYYREGNSDKVYQASLEECEAGFLVNFAYGRRGTALKTGTKTASPVPFEKAKAAYDKLVKSKMAKGYSPGEDGTPYRHTDKEDLNTGIYCQLLNSVEKADAERLIEDPDYWMQEKKDGRRLLIRKADGEITGINRKGIAVGISKSIEKAARDIEADFILDGECLGDCVHVFDLLDHEGEDLRKAAYGRRLERLTHLISKGENRAILLVETLKDPADKRAAFERFESEGREGVVFKHHEREYKAGRPNSGGPHLKYKFYKTASAIVAAASGTKRSVALELISDKGRVPAGNVTIQANHTIPPKGAIVEVRYLYAYKESGSFYQPVYLGQRNDIDAKSCTIKQLKYRTPTEDDEA